MKLSKVTKKLNNKLLNTLQTLQSQVSQQLNGFVKLEHTVQFDLFPSSLLVTCYFENDSLLAQAKASERLFQKQLHKLLFKQGILLKDPSHNLNFCTQ